MIEKIYFHLLILCGILCRGIIATLLNEDGRESSDFLVRKRRVISHLPGELNPIHVNQANYIVNIREDSRAHCAGTILSHYTVITAALCVPHDVSNYKVISGTGAEKNSSFHNITSITVHYGDTPHKEYDGISLIRVNPPFTFGPSTGNILLHVGPLSVGTQVNVIGWGSVCPIRPIMNIRRRLRRITLPIMNHRECQTVYHGRFDITEKHICTYDKEKYCVGTDTGAPLVSNNRLVGIHVWKGENPSLRNPDVFIDLQRTDYSTWISENSHLM